MTKSEHRIKVDNGKYTFVTRSDGNAWKIVSDGQTRTFQIDGRDAIAAMMVELDAARVVVQAVRKYVAAKIEQCPTEIFDALAIHDRLTSDREPPSAWCGEEPTTTPCPSSTLRDAVHSAVAGALHDKEPTRSVAWYRALCDEIAGRVMEAIEEVQGQGDMGPECGTETKQP